MLINSRTDISSRVVIIVELIRKLSLGLQPVTQNHSVHRRDLIPGDLVFDLSLLSDQFLEGWTRMKKGHSAYGVSRQLSYLSHSQPRGK